MNASNRRLRFIPALLWLGTAPALLPACEDTSPTGPSTISPSPTSSPAPVTNSSSPDEARSSAVRIAAPPVTADDAAALAAGNLAFAVDLHARLRAQNTANFVFSPASISIALAMLYGGAATTTAAEMAATLHFTLPPERLHPAMNALDQALTAAPAGADPTAFRLNIADSTWIQRGFSPLPSYLDLLAQNYGAGLFVEDFAGAAETARAAINGWVSDQTQSLIPQLFGPGTIDASTVLVLANAIFFHGDWKTPFMSQTQTGTFHAPAGDVSVPMMFGSDNAAIWSGAGFNAAELAYVGGTSAMVIVVPDAGTFDAFESGLTADAVTALLAPANHVTGNVVLPRFGFATPTPLEPTLAAMGMPDLFSSTADLSGIDGARDLLVQTVIHKAVIAVDQQGTTAAAATGVSVGRNAVTTSLAVDRPFLFFIVHAPTGAILFQGRVIDPSQG